jgi:hypothetical protein
MNDIFRVSGVLFLKTLFSNSEFHNSETDVPKSFDFTALLCFIHVIRIIPSTQLLSINSVFILTHYMFRPYFWVTFGCFTRLNINHPNRYAVHSNRTWVPCS